MASSGGSACQILVCHNTLWVRASRGPGNAGVGGRGAAAAYALHQLTRANVQTSLPVQTRLQPTARADPQTAVFWKGPSRGGHRYLSANDYTYIQDRQPPCHRHHILVYVVALHWYLYSPRYMFIYTYQDMHVYIPRYVLFISTPQSPDHPNTRLPSCFYCLCVSDTSPPEPLEMLQEYPTTRLPSCVSCLCLPDASPPETLFQHDDLFNLINNLPPPMHESALGSQSEQELLTAMAKASAAAAAAATGSELASRQSGLENGSMVCLQTEGRGQGSTNLRE